MNATTTTNAVAKAVNAYDLRTRVLQSLLTISNPPVLRRQRAISLNSNDDDSNNNGVMAKQPTRE